MLETTDFIEIGTRNNVKVSWPVGDPDSGGQGTVWRASIGGNPGFCVKALPQVTTPAAINRELRALQVLRLHIDNRLEVLKAPAICHSLRTLRAYLPTHAATGTVPGESSECLLLLRRFCEGKSLQELTAPGGRTPALGTRVEIAKRLVRHLASLEKLGFVHLDPYPDNVFLGGDERLLEVVLIDLEGVGSVARDSQGRFGQALDAFEKEPSAFGKPEVWILPYWYPSLTRPALKPFIEHFVSAARWQALCAAFFAVTWGCKPFFWLSRRSQQALARAYKKATVIPPGELTEILRDISSGALDLAAKRLGGNLNKLDEFSFLMAKGFADPRDIPRGEELQALFYDRNWR